MACWTAGDPLALAACARSENDLGLGAKVRDIVALDHGVERECSPSLSLAPATMTAVDNERSRFYLISHLLAIATSGDREGDR